MAGLNSPAIFYFAWKFGFDFVYYEAFESIYNVSQKEFPMNMAGLRQPRLQMQE